jgi:CheY-like chemotaxis protein/predicted regulator of Ras-like GTPase activity (Roadblock/LC7/MglB family)
MIDFWAEGTRIISHFHICTEADLAQRILVIDPDVAFATLLKEGLERTGEYSVTTIGDGAQPMEILSRDQFALVILDMGWANPPALQVARSLRARQPHLPLMLIPLGDTMPEAVSELGIQGVLTKPFFLPDLPDLVARALRAQPQLALPPPATLPEPTAVPPPPPAQSRRSIGWQDHAAELNQFLSALARELDADAVMLICGDDLIAYAGRFSRQDAERLSRLVGESWRASSQATKPVGREKVRFEQPMREGGDYLLYSLSVAEDSVLSMAFHTNTPLGTIRSRARQTAEALSRLASQP